MKFPFPSLNDALNNSKKEKGLLSIWGDYGVGKTTFSIQIALENLNEYQKIFYIYTKPNLPIEKIKRLFEITNQETNKIIFIKIDEFKDISDFISKLEPLFLKKVLNESSFFIFDSITDLYRLQINKNKQLNLSLNYKLNFMLASLHYLLANYNTNIIIVNDSSQKLQNDNYTEIQSGGKVMDYWITTSLHIKRTESINKRIITLKENRDNIKLKLSLTLTDKGFQLYD